MPRGDRKFSQAERPRGSIGRLLGWLMRRMNWRSYRWTVDQLRPIKPQSILEIGFGTGDMLAMAAKKLKPARIAGVDPSELMVNSAKKRLRRFRRKIATDLKLGDDTTLQKDGPFDAIVALHSFQFWTHPSTSLAEIGSLLAPEGRLIFVLRLHGKRSDTPNPLSRKGDEITAATEAFQKAGFAILSMRALSRSSYGIVLGWS